MKTLILMDILKNNWDSPSEYVVSLFNIFCNTSITKKQIRNHIQYLQFFLKNNTNVHVNEILSNPFTLVPFIKKIKNPKIQMEHSHLIIECNVTPIYIFDWALYYNNIFELLEVCPNLTY
jgi:hypothetical protein